MSDRDLVTSIQAYGDLDALIENMRYEEVVIDRLVRQGAFLPGEAATARTMTARTDISLEEAQDSSAAVSGAEVVPPSVPRPVWLTTRPRPSRPSGPRC
ncbi:hypothetical protein [Demequina litorisediminis]|uniref:Uncharacterized protein n=1 Tax=Demequina litorisediminis TaxID=1849022 RepID=A0ABQ6ICH1_9MICO|nr:hypothetical protein [Demequina litorisediminis]GMA35485.1 hypothetical protein GCM10025876_16890 [Demequina litorisediminis]